MREGKGLANGKFGGGRLAAAAMALLGAAIPAATTGCIVVKADRAVVSPAAPNGELPLETGRWCTLFYLPATESDPGVATGKLVQVLDDWVTVRESPGREIRLRTSQIVRVEYSDPPAAE